MTLLFNFLNSIRPLSDELVQHLSKVLKTKTFPKKTLLLKAGQVCQNMYFIESGLVRCFYIKGENEVCSWFMKEGDMIISVQSFFYQQESYESIQALEDLKVHYISFADLQFIYRELPELNFIGRILTEKYYALSEQRLYSLRMQRAQERYEYLVQHSSELILRVPSNYIASYLGITKETLSRVRSKKQL
jgi:CRP-like cAMP-binding protein